MLGVSWPDSFGKGPSKNYPARFPEMRCYTRNPFTIKSKKEKKTHQNKWRIKVVYSFLFWLIKMRILKKRKKTLETHLGTVWFLIRIYKGRTDRSTRTKVISQKPWRTDRQPLHIHTIIQLQIMSNRIQDRHKVIAKVHIAFS